jgi:hypothetical protein
LPSVHVPEGSNVSSVAPSRQRFGGGFAHVTPAHGFPLHLPLSHPFAHGCVLHVYEHCPAMHDPWAVQTFRFEPVHSFGGGVVQVTPSHGPASGPASGSTALASRGASAAASRGDAPSGRLSSVPADASGSGLAASNGTTSTPSSDPAAQEATSTATPRADATLTRSLRMAFSD